MNKNKISARRPTPRRLAPGRRTSSPQKTDSDEAASVDADASDARETESVATNAPEGEVPPT
jgi:hypothetical protein